MTKRIFSLLLALVFVLALMPAGAGAAGPTLLTKYFSNGITAPQAAYLRYNGVDTDHGDSIDMWYNLPPELLALAADYNKWYEADGEQEGFVAAFGVEDCEIKIQVDAQLDGGAWQYTSAWDDPDWGGMEEPNWLVFSNCFSENMGNKKFYENNCMSWLIYLEEGAEGFLAPIVYSAENEEGFTLFHYDLKNHTMAVRYRFAVRYVTTGDYESHVLLSGWSPVTSIGKNGTQKALTRPSSLAAPALSDFSMEVYNENGVDFLSAKYYIDVPDSVYDAVKYCQVNDLGDAVYIDAQIRVNGGAWDGVYTANNNWIFSDYRSAAPDEYALKKTDNVEIRARFVCEELGLTSAWSNIVGTKPAFTASAWALEELAEADALGLIPDALREADLTKPITRAEFAAVSVKVFEALTFTKAPAVSDNPFTDTADPEVLKALGLGVTNGMSATTFEPDRLLNREQAATMLTRVFKKVNLSGWTLETDGSFNEQFRGFFTMPELFGDDANISAWAKDSVYFMAANGIIKGMGSDANGKPTFAPKDVTEAQKAVGYANATRQQALLIAVRMVKNLG